jgi:hexulose-6-phosphate isomerase
MRRLIRGSAAVGVEILEIPCVDQSSLATPDHRNELVTAVEAVLEEAAEHGVALLLETDLPPLTFRALLERFDHESVGANYDTGNSASLGYDMGAEVRILGPWIRNVHIKDRLLGGSTVPLGEGAASFDRFFEALAVVGYKGPFILQTARDVDDVGVAGTYLRMVKGWMQNHVETAPS